GAVNFRDERGQVKCASNEEEFAQMAEYVKAMDITWPIAFAKEEVFNPDFGVRGIPHVAIIGADGRTAYNNLDPRDPMTEKVKKINGLLMKAGLPHPPAFEG
ncbi:MAG: hypothetical protein VX109_04890, partial [Planctomycetota bacterium]|nr:hypothetical protein [Planctomycetota bacterium]